MISLSRTILLALLNMLRIEHLAYAFPFIMQGKYKHEYAVPPYDSGTWEEACRILSKMLNLHELYIHLVGSLLDHKIDDVLKPLYQIQQTKVFEVFVGIGQDPKNSYHHYNMTFRFV